jgi:hypothetical protein
VKRAVQRAVCGRRSEPVNLAFASNGPFETRIEGPPQSVQAIIHRCNGAASFEGIQRPVYVGPMIPAHSSSLNGAVLKIRKIVPRLDFFAGNLSQVLPRRVLMYDSNVSRRKLQGCRTPSRNYNKLISAAHSFAF